MPNSNRDEDRKNQRHDANKIIRLIDWCATSS